MPDNTPGVVTTPVTTPAYGRAGDYLFVDTARVSWAIRNGDYLEADTAVSPVVRNGDYLEMEVP